MLPLTTRRSTAVAETPARTPLLPEAGRPRRPCAFAPGALALIVLGCLLVGACRGKGRSRRPADFTWLRTPAAGRPSTCPEDAVDFGDGVPTTHAQRCSFADAERDLVHVRGKVIQEVPGALARGLAEVDVVFVRILADGTDGPPLARATTDAQGAFSLKLDAKPGEYAIVAGLARAPVEVVKKGPRTFADVMLLVPATP